MSEPERKLYDRAVELREAFDLAFAERETEGAEAQLELLFIRVRGHAYGVRLSQVLSLHADRRLVPVPSARPELLGLLGLRGQVVPVYDLSLLLGYEPGMGLRWVMLVRAATPLALAFEHFDAQLRVPPGAVVAAADATPGQRFAPASVTTVDGARPVLDLTALVADLTARGRKSAPEREERP